METLEPSAQRAKSRLRSAAVMFYLMAVVKLLALFTAMRPPVGGDAPPLPPQSQTAIFAWYTATVVVCSAIGFALERRMRGSRPAALVVGGLHALALPLVIFGVLGIMSLITGILGVMAVGSIAVASALEKLDERAE
ncbi:MAG: hypothetical protein HYU52_04675 [Acidobacteria bacterium]|nr:hypothetical protein [Acidobacteriota bacterium]